MPGAAPLIAPNDLFAAYGLLRDGGGGLERLGLVGSLTRVSACVIPGLLYDLGGFPGIVEGEGRVAADLFRVNSAEAGAAMDEFEDFDPEDPGGSSYVRRKVQLIEPEGETAWVYVWTRAVSADERIASGDWLAHRNGS